MVHISGVRWRVMGAVATCVLALAACGGGSDDGAEPEAGETSASPDDDLGGLLGAESAAPEPSDPLDMLADQMEDGTVVLDHGRSPRVVQSFEPEVGERLTSTMRMTMSTTANGETSPPLPAVLESSIEVLEVIDDLATVRTILDDVFIADGAGLPREMAEEFESQMSAVEGLAVTTDHDGLGAVVDTRYSLPDNAPPSAHLFVEQFVGNVSASSLPFPTEPVGEGGSWAVVETREVGGLTMTMTTTYVLEELDGDRYRLALEMDDTFDPTTDGPVELERGTIVGSSVNEGVLGSLVPSKVTTSTTTTLVARAQGRRLESVTESDLEMTTRAR